MSYTYNLDGSVATMTYPSGAVITYTPDSAGRVLSAVDASNNINYVTGATYNAPGALTGSTYGQSGSFSGISQQLQLQQPTAAGESLVVLAHPDTDEPDLRFPLG
jgi:YD repeat-containing protein